MTVNRRPPLPPHNAMHPAASEWMRQISRGNLSNTGSITLTSSTSLTTVYTPLPSGVSHITLTPVTAAAATEPWYIASQAAGASFTISHSVGASNTDRVFTWAVFA